eukprot:1803966-Ditylum_brightwellii.AAC.1
MQIYSVNAILNAAQRKPVQVEPKMPPPVDSDSEDDEAKPTPGMRQRRSMVEIVSNMLRKNKSIDSTATSIQSLEAMTNASMKSKCNALSILTKILSGDKEGNIEILKAIMSLLQIT